MTEMSEFRRPAPSMLDHVGVGGMLKYDNLEEESALTSEAAAPSGESRGNLETGLRGPVQSSSHESTSTWVGRVLIGVKELGRHNGLDEAAMAELVGRLAIELCRRIPPI